MLLASWAPDIIPGRFPGFLGTSCVMLLCLNVKIFNNSDETWLWLLFPLAFLIGARCALKARLDRVAAVLRYRVFGRILSESGLRVCVFCLVSANTWLASFGRIINGICAACVWYRVTTYLLFDAGPFISVEAWHVVVGARTTSLHYPLLAGERVAILDRLRMVLAALEVESGSRVLIRIVWPLRTVEHALIAIWCHLDGMVGAGAIVFIVATAHSNCPLNRRVLPIEAFVY